MAWILQLTLKIQPNELSGIAPKGARRMWYWLGIAVVILLADFAIACLVGLSIYRFGGRGEETVDFEKNKSSDQFDRPLTWFASRF